MKTMDQRSRLPRPLRFAIYLIMVSAMGLMNWMAIYANDPGMASSASLEARLAMALEPVPDPEPELEDWILTFATEMNKERKASNSRLEDRLAEAEKPVDDPQPELEDWLLNFSDNMLSTSGE